MTRAPHSIVAYPQVEGRAGGTRRICALALALLLGACSANGDYGRLKPGLVADDIHAWVGRDAARAAYIPVSSYPLTDEERLLRDLGYPLIEPPFDRARWYSIVNEYGVSHAFGWPGYDIARYGDRLLWKDYRSASARYARLNSDIRNDVVRIPDFFMTARRVIDLDRKRAASFPFVTSISPDEKLNATARIAENELVVAWVQGSLVERSLAYCNALQRLVVATPSPMAIEVERSLTLLNTRIAENRVIATPQFGPPFTPCGATVAAAPSIIPVVTK